ncbi:L-2-amino-thiazoline-4-carboxylic acid hydrolase [Limibacterium fermenti]|uniref:L-2-amino-thiazoline-4-carboxylic acid hydrolase n=1 Tax=Limibacterium fermenti TaxID=3229863 RepID=UPI003A6339C1
MDKEIFDYDKSASSPLDNYRLIEQGVFEYLRDEKILETDRLDTFAILYQKKFEALLPKVQSLICNDLDKGNVYFVLITVSVYELFLEQGLSQEEAFVLTDRCINKPLRKYLVEGTRLLLDYSADPFDTLVAASKEREATYFGDSFDFERLMDDSYGYILHIKRCLFHETLRVLGRTGLQPILCRMDLGWINGIDPERHRVQFVRPVTFASADVCRMCFMRKEKEAIKD